MKTPSLLFLLSLMFFYGRDLLGAEPTPFALDPSFSLTLAQATSGAAYNDEKQGKFADALKGYEQVIKTADMGTKETDARGEARTSEMYLVIGAAHLDVARMQHELPQMGSAVEYKKQQAEIDEHLAIAGNALNKARQTAVFNIKSGGATQIRIGVPKLSNKWLIEQTIGDLSLFKSDLIGARVHFQSALQLNPKSEHAEKALLCIDIAEKRKSAEELERKGWKIPSEIKSMPSEKLTRDVATELVKWMFGRFGPLTSSIAGRVTDALLKKAAGVKD